MFMCKCCLGVNEKRLKKYGKRYNQLKKHCGRRIQLFMEGDASEVQGDLKSCHPY